MRPLWGILAIWVTDSSWPVSDCRLKPTRDGRFVTRSRLSRMAALVRGDDRQILFMLSERYESHAAYQIRCRELGVTLTLEGKGAL
jgi:hypothetical protein